MRLALGKKEIQIPHPEHPEVVARIARLGNVQRLILQEKAAKAMNGGSLAELFATVEEALRGPLLGVDGIEDLPTAVPETPEGFRAYIDMLMDAKLAVPTTTKMKVKQINSVGTEVEIDKDVPMRLWFPVWLISQMNKPERWAPDLDPKESQPQ